MYSLEEIGQVEHQYREGAPSLGKALNMLLDRWKSGERDEETALRLLFLLWYNIVEPINLTGLSQETDSSLFVTIFREAGGASQARPVILFAVGKMAEMFPWAIGDEKEWGDRSRRLIDKAIREEPDISAETFAGRGAAGDYFQHILTCEHNGI